MIVELGDSNVYGVVKNQKLQKMNMKMEYKKERLWYQAKRIQRCQISKSKIGRLSPGNSLKIQFEYIQQLQVFMNQFWKLELSSMVDTSYLAINKLKNTSKNFAQQRFFLKNLANIQAMKFNYKQNITVIINMQKLITYAKSHNTLNYTNDPENISPNKKFEQMLNTKTIFVIKFKSMEIGENFQNEYYQTFGHLNLKFELLFSSNDFNNSYAILSNTKPYRKNIHFFVQIMMLYNILNIVLLQPSFLNLMNFQQMMPINHILMVQIYLNIKNQKGCGSMEGIRIEKAKQSLILFRKSLPEDSIFNFISFGSDVEKMFDIEQAYNQHTLNQAIKYVQEMNADLGGTDILKALSQGIYNEKLLIKQIPFRYFKRFFINRWRGFDQKIIKFQQQDKITILQYLNIFIEYYVMIKIYQQKKLT
ncbi:unnamed protein product [Paramecium primaurelia]|uniref:VWFA domain-containing protein n=1 Tax=Paramecium primaurelia TaxID=5886 RepID=A0A8S1QPD2_PARPR|nr:unnamed protein product [Paramecium primaurelia]